MRQFIAAVAAVFIAASENQGVALFADIVLFGQRTVQFQFAVGMEHPAADEVVCIAAGQGAACEILLIKRVQLIIGASENRHADSVDGAADFMQEPEDAETFVKAFRRFPWDPSCGCGQTFHIAFLRELVQTFR